MLDRSFNYRSPTQNPVTESIIKLLTSIGPIELGLCVPTRLPGHAQIAGNELIDLAVKQATSMYSSHNLSVPYDDVYL